MPSEAPKLIRVARSRVRPDKVKEYEELVKNEVFPAYQKAGRTLTVRRVRFGAPTGEYWMSTRISGFAEMETDPVQQAMGAETYARMVAKLTPLTTERELNVLRFREDLSYSAPQTTTTAAR
jgi:hypothetical protein